MINFKEIKITDKDEIKAKLALEPEQMTERSFTDVYIWAGRYKTQYTIVNGFLFMGGREDEDGVVNYMFPIGKGDRVAAIDLIRKDAQERGKKYRILAVSPKQKEEIEHSMKNEFEFIEDRDNFDYIYKSADLRSLSGKKLHAKRNYINRFMQVYGDRYTYEAMDGARDREEIMNFHSEWCENHDPNSVDTTVHESCAVSRCLKNFEALEMRGGILRIEGKMTAFTMGSPLTEDTFIVQIEKALADVDGAYPLINREFIENSASEFEFIDREEDLGIPGLRAAKMSYNPCKLSEKYIMVPAND